MPYVAICATVVREMMALKADVEPRLMAESRTEMTPVSQIELTGRWCLVSIYCRLGI